jgi:hypothetical protein
MDQIIRVCYRDGYIDNIDGFGGVSALIVKLCEADFEQSISNMIKNQTLVEWSLGGPLPNLCPVIPTSNQDGRQA